MANYIVYVQVQDLVVNNGDDLDIPITVLQGPFPSTVPQDITGWTFTFMLKNLQTDSVANAVLVNSVTTHVDPINGLTCIYNTAATTANLSGYYYCYLSWVDNFGGSQCFLKGKINFTI